MRVPRDEVAQRVTRLRQYLREHDVEGAVILDALNFAYLTGFHLDVDTWERPVALIVPAAGPAVAIVNELSSHAWELAREEGLVVADQVIVYREHSQVPKLEPTLAEWTELVGRTAGNLGITRGVGSDRPDTAERLVRVATKMTDLEPFVREMRRVKSRAELEIFRQSGVITDWAQERYRELLRPGRYIQEVDHEVATLLEIRAAKEFPKSHLKLLVISFAGPDTAYPHGMCGWPGRKIEHGHMVSTNVAFRIDGLGAENERVWSMGTPDDRFRKLFDTARQAQRVGVQTCMPGRQFCEIDAAAQQVIEAAGCGPYSVHRSGHGVGLGLHEYPTDTAFNQETMRDGEVMAVEPGIYVRGFGGFRHSDTIIVGPNGPEILTKFPKDLPSLTVQ